MGESIVLILAAGNSSRLGEPKQLILVDGTTLLNKVVLEAVKSGVSKVVVMLGAYDAEIERRLPEFPGRLNAYKFREWSRGMGATLKEGVRLLLQNAPDTENLIVATCDQPFLHACLFDAMLEKAEHMQDKKIIACRYSEKGYGVPVLFKRCMFDELLNIEDDKGARSLVVKYLDNTGFVDFPEGTIDIDTRQDLENFRYGL